MNSDSLNMVSRLGEGHMPCTFFLSEPQLKTTVSRPPDFKLFSDVSLPFALMITRPATDPSLKEGNSHVKSISSSVLVSDPLRFEGGRG